MESYLCERRGAAVAVMCTLSVDPVWPGLVLESSKQFSALSYL